MVQDILSVETVESNELALQIEQNPQLEPGENIVLAQCVQEAN
jgi:hypothetical protein